MLVGSSKLAALRRGGARRQACRRCAPSPPRSPACFVDRDGRRTDTRGARLHALPAACSSASARLRPGRLGGSTRRRPLPAASPSCSGPHETAAGSPRRAAHDPSPPAGRQRPLSPRRLPATDLARCNRRPDGHLTLNAAFLLHTARPAGFGLPGVSRPVVKTLRFLRLPVGSGETPGQRRARILTTHFRQTRGRDDQAP